MSTTTRIPLPDDNWAELRDPKKVPEALRRPVTSLQAQMAMVVDTKAIQALDKDETMAVSDKNIAKTKALGVEGIALAAEIGDLSAVALVESWSFGSDITVATVQGLPGDCYDALSRAVAPLSLQMHTKFEPTPDPESPSEPSQP